MRHKLACEGTMSDLNRVTKDNQLSLLQMGITMPWSTALAKCSMCRYVRMTDRMIQMTNWSKK